jgi:hypothetical protein
MSKHSNTKSNSSIQHSLPPLASEDLEVQIDRLNQALKIIMQEIEADSHHSKVHLSHSMLSSEICEENNFSNSEEVHLP